MSQKHSSFISYRRADGKPLAIWIYENLNGRSKLIKDGLGLESVCINVEMDLSMPGGTNWIEHLNNYLHHADSLIVVCSPAANLTNRNQTEYFNEELRWWGENHLDHPPILVATSEFGNHYVPEFISQTWPNLNVLEIDTLLFEAKTKQASLCREVFSESIINGMLSGSRIQIQDDQQNKKINITGVFAWEKDRHHRYIWVNENYARAAGFDSPSAMLGKTDEEMPWHSLAKFFQEGDRELMLGNPQTRMLIFEKEIMIDRVADILVHEEPILNDSQRITGVKGCFFDITGDPKFTSIIGKYVLDDHGVKLGPDFEYQFIDCDEIAVFRNLVRGYSKRQIALAMQISLNQVKSTIKSLKQKLQCRREQDILSVAVRAGLPIELFGSLK